MGATVDDDTAALCAPPVASDEDVSPTCILFLKELENAE
ncbi:hypothetical protein ECSTEC7V_0316 [Escherichia coli STEC_7v]|nr:hypothetical protein ECSTEC7V_0316 [Escherichia coli STEC_7v]